MSLWNFFKRMWEIFKSIFVKRTRRTYLKEWLEADRVDKGRLIRVMEELASRVYAEATTNNAKVGELKTQLRASQRKIEQFYQEAKEAQARGDSKAEKAALKRANLEAEVAAKLKASLTSFQVKIKEMYAGWEQQKAQIEESYAMLQQQEVDDSLRVARNDMLKSMAIFQDTFSKFAEVIPEFGADTTRKDVDQEIAYDEAKLEGKRQIREALWERKRAGVITAGPSEEAELILQEARQKVGYTPAMVPAAEEAPAEEKHEEAETF